MKKIALQNNGSLWNSFTALVFFYFLLVISPKLTCQVAVNTTGNNPDPSAMLDVSSSNAGLLIPRMSATQRDDINSPAAGLIVYVYDDNNFYYYNGIYWTPIKSGETGWVTNGNKLYTDTTILVGIGTSNPSGRFEVATIFHAGNFGADQCTGGLSSASDYSGSGNEADKAFDDDNDTSWENNNNFPAWLQYDFGDGNMKRIAKYHIHFKDATSDYSHSPDAWTFEASNNGENWEILDIRTGEGWSSNGWKEYLADNTVYYRYYRININDNLGSSDDYVSIFEMEMLEENLNNHPTLYVNDNKVGIGTDVPLKTLDVNGSFRLTDGSEGEGKVLISDASGNATWTDGTSVIGDGWTISGNYIYITDDSVGIGTSSPIALLDVHGSIAQTGTGHSVFLGEGAGFSDDLSDNQNVFLGHQTGNANITGYGNTASGSYSLFNNTTAHLNVGIGTAALYHNTDRNNLVAIGDSALYHNGQDASNYWDATGNTATGSKALYSNTAGYNNTAYGFEVLYSNSTGYDNTASGYNALHSNAVGNSNTAMGRSALYNNSEGYQNTAMGNYALYSNTSGSYNNAQGLDALYSNSTGSLNTAGGYRALYNNTTGSLNTANGYEALYSNTTGYSNIAIGVQALNQNSNRNNLVAIGDSALYHNGEGVASPDQALANSAVGSKALYANTIGSNNTANGYQALYSNTAGYNNTAAGKLALYSNISGHHNTSIGNEALYLNSGGFGNTAIGCEALFWNGNGHSNVAIGSGSLRFSSDCSFLVAIGDSALYNNGKLAQGGLEGYYNTAVGSKALFNDNKGFENVAVGFHTLYDNLSGWENTAVGSNALHSNTFGVRNTAIGVYALTNNTTGSNNSAFGRDAFYFASTVNNSTALGSGTAITASNQIRLGSSSVTSIGGYAAWTNISDKRVKIEIKEEVPGLDFIMKLRPVTYHLDMDAIAIFNHTPDSLRLFDSEQLKSSQLQTGFIAQEVEQAAQSLNYNFSGVDAPKNENDFYGLRYAEFVVPLVKAMQEQQEMIKNLVRENSDLKEQMIGIMQRIEKLED